MIHIIRTAKYLSLGIIILFFILFCLSWTPFYKPNEMEYGLTFSDKQASDLGLDWKGVYIAMLDDLKIKKLRLPAYWDELAKNPNEYNWSNLDWQIDEAEKRNVELIIVVGQRVPRWPECHIPDWAEQLNEKDRQKATIDHIRQVVSRYKTRPTIKFWQVENEPFLKYFGTCPEFKKEFLDQEIKEVKSLDTKPIIITDSGELSFWIPAAKRADVFGSTMYLNTYSRVLQSYIRYPIAPVFFRVKKNITNLFTSPQDWLIIELQGEPWGKTSFQNLSEQERNRTMDEKKFIETIDFIQRTGFKTFYWWGVEFWYWEKTNRNNPFYWDTARQLFNGSYVQP